MPMTMDIAVSSEPALRSTILSLAISSTCALVILATLSRLGFADADSMPAAFLIRTAAGGLLSTNVVGVDTQYRGDNKPLFVARALVELFYEACDVDAVRTQARTDGRSRGRFTGGKLQFDDCL